MQRRHLVSRRSLVLLGVLMILASSPSWALAQHAIWETYNHAGMKAYQAGRYAEAEKLFTFALKAAEESGVQDQRLATSLNNLALVYKAQAKYDQAEPLYKRSLAIYEKALGPDHPHVATSLNNLAGLYRAQAKYDQAEPLYKRSLAIYEKALGPDHPHVTASLENYGTMLKAVKRDVEAEPLLRRAAQIREKRRQ